MFFKKGKKRVKEGMSDMDKLITWMVIGGAAASIFGLSRSAKWKKKLSKTVNTWGNILKKAITEFWKVTVKTISLFQKK